MHALFGTCAGLNYKISAKSWLFSNCQSYGLRVFLGGNRCRATSPARMVRGGFASSVESKQVLWEKLTSIKAFQEHASSAENTINDFCLLYEAKLTNEQKSEFLLELSSKLGSSDHSVIHHGGKTPTPEILDLMMPAYEELFKLVAGERADGVGTLVRLRGDLLALLRRRRRRQRGGGGGGGGGGARGEEGGANEEDAGLALLDWCLREELGRHCAPARLRLERVTFDGTPGGVLERLAKYEAVHRVRSLEELKRRLGPHGRRCYALFHPHAPLEPLVFVYAALLPTMPGSMAELRDRRWETAGAEAGARAACFYSISASQPGLAGVSELGNQLIKRVSALLQQDHPSLDTFCTLSPIPGFRIWLDHMLENWTQEGGGRGEGGFAVFSDTELFHLMNFHSGLEMGRGNGIQSYKERVFALNDSRLLKSTIQSDDWCGDEECKAALKPILMGLCTKYLLEVKGTKESKIKDPVGNFHIQNGAQMARLNWNADPSLNGIEKSAGIMINYQYFPTRTFQSALNYASTGSFNVSTFFRKAAFPSTIMQSSTKIASSSSSSLGGGSENKKVNGDKDDDAAYYIISPKNAALADGAIPSQNKNVASKL